MIEVSDALIYLMTLKDIHIKEDDFETFKNIRIFEKFWECFDNEQPKELFWSEGRDIEYHGEYV